jgi:tetraacyldisaccharide 4'-kinase
MRLEPPGWWYGSRPLDRFTAALLEPAGYLYGTAAKARFALTSPYRSRLPVICVGNFTVGGAGKTPLALAVARLVRKLGHEPAFLIRGYGGRLAGPHRVDPAHDDPADVGDEALLLARAAPTIVARDRPAGAKAIDALGVSLIIMDDGFQNPSLVKDFTLLAVDGAAGIGNGRVFPAGPLRAPLRFQIDRAQASVLIGGRGDGGAFLGGQIPAMKAELRPVGETGWLRGRPLLAFSGIGRPAKFFDTLRANGATLAGAEAFPDHHSFSEADATALIRKAEKTGALLVTTEKDHVRMSAPSGPLADLKAAARGLPVALVFAGDDGQRLRKLLFPILKH